MPKSTPTKKTNTEQGSLSVKVPFSPSVRPSLFATRIEVKRQIGYQKFIHVGKEPDCERKLIIDGRVDDI